jgi:membrane-associated phospholipid phosphatase
VRAQAKALSPTLSQSTGRGRKGALLIGLPVLAIAAALDSPTAHFIRDSGLEQFFRNHRTVAAVLKSPGTYYFTTAIALIVAVVHRRRSRAAVFVLLASAVSGVNGAVKWIVGRHRPFKPPDGSGRFTPFDFHPFPHEGKNLCFPSGHACLAFATAAALGMLWPRWRWAFYVGAAIVAFERVAENAHWLSDSVAAAALGIVGVFLIRKLDDRFALFIPRDPLLQRAGKPERASVASRDGSNADR